MSHPDDDTLGAFDSTPFRVEWTSDGHATEDSIYAWLDGALDDNGRDAIERHANGCASCEAEVAEARGYIAASMRIMHAADLSPRHVVSRDDVARAAARIVAAAKWEHVPLTPRWSTRTITRVAAGLFLMLAGAAYVATRDGSGRALVQSASSACTCLAHLAGPFDTTS